MASKIPDSVCSAPWSHFAISSHPDGFITMPCCRFRMGSDSRFRNVKFQKPNHAVSKDGYFEDIRQRMLAGEKLSECEKCWREERDRGYSMRKTMIKQTPLEKISQNTSFELKYLEVFFGNLCNLSCRMCDITQSSQWANLYNNAFVPNNIQDTSVVPDDFLEANGRAKTQPISFDNTFLEGIDLSKLTEVKILGGEPMMTPDHITFLDQLMFQSNDPSAIKLVYHTNGTKIPTQKVVDYWKQMKKIEIVFSIDGYGKTNEYQRINSQWQNIVDNIKWYSNLGINLHMRIHSVLSLLTIWTVDNLCEWAETEFKKIVNWPTNMNGLFNPQMKTLTFDFVSKPSYLDLTIMPIELKEKCSNYINSCRFLDNTTKNFIVAHMNSNSYNKKNWEDFWIKMTAIDKFTKQNLIDIAPQLEEYRP